MAGKGGKRSTSFKPGQSGNPGGRPKISHNVQELARQYTTEAIEALCNCLRDKKARQGEKVAAANSLLDRGYGRPTQHVDAKVSIFDSLDLDQRRALDAVIASVTGDAADTAVGESPTHH